MSLVALLFITLGFLAGMAYPDLDTASITAYLAHRYDRGIAGVYFKVINGLVSVAVVATFPLQLSPVAQVIYNMCDITSGHAKLLVRVLAVLGCALMAFIVGS